MAQTFSFSIFSAQNLLNGSGEQAFRSSQTGVRNVGGQFTTGNEAAQTISIVDDFNTTDPDQNNDQIDEFDDGTGARQTLGGPVTLTFRLNGATVTRTFPAGSQIQAEFRLPFDNGAEIVGIRIENPLFGQPGEPDLITAGYAVIGQIPPPNTSFGGADARAGNSSGDVAYADIPCFTPGAMVDTPDGPRAVQDLRPGDLVMTRDNGAQVITWTGERRVTADELAARPDWSPVRTASGLILSPLHRVLRSDGGLSLVTGEAELLIEARHLGQPLRPKEGVTYLHFACDRHEIVRADGLWVETLLRGDGSDPLMAEVTGHLRAPARPLLRGYEARALGPLLHAA